MLVIGILLSFIWMCVLPFLTGALLLPHFAKSKCGGIRTMLFSVGLMLHYLLFEILVLSGKAAGLGMRAVSLIYLALALPLSAGGLFCLIRKRRLIEPLVIPSPLREPCFWIGILLIAVQIGAVLFMATPDLDDAFYSGLSAMSISQDYLLEKNAYGGLMLSDIESRYALSGLPVYQGALSFLSAGLHPLIIQHNLFPLFYLPLTYALFYALGKKLMGKKADRGAFLMTLALLHIFGNYYVFSPENFPVTRLWQGKALFVALGIPTLWLLTTEAAAKRKSPDKASAVWWLLVGATLVAVTFMGETGLFLGPVMVMALTLSVCIVDKRLKPLLWAFCSCLPEAVMLLWLLKGR